jgi:hypothetical protein
MPDTNGAEPELTDVQKAYNVAQSDMLQEALYGDCKHWPARELLTDEGKRQQRAYADVLYQARTDLEAGLLRLVAEHAETYFTGWDPVAAWLRFLADDPGELSMLALRPDERDDETFDEWRAESMTARLAATDMRTRTPCTCRQAVHAAEHTNRPVDGCPWCTSTPNIRPNPASRAVTTVDARLLRAKPDETQGADRVVAYRSALPGALSLYCTRHADELGACLPLTSDDLPDGCVCVQCGVDLLIQQNGAEQ